MRGAFLFLVCLALVPSYGLAALNVNDVNAMIPVYQWTQVNDPGVWYVSTAGATSDWTVQGVDFMIWSDIVDDGTMHEVYNCYNPRTQWYLTSDFQTETDIDPCTGGFFSIGWLKTNPTDDLVPVYRYTARDNNNHYAAVHFTTTAPSLSVLAHTWTDRIVLGYTWAPVDCTGDTQTVRCPADSSNAGAVALKCNTSAHWLLQSDIDYYSNSKCRYSSCPLCTGCKAPFPSNVTAFGSGGSCAHDFPSGSTCSITCDDNYTVKGDPYQCNKGVRSGAQSCVSKAQLRVAEVNLLVPMYSFSMNADPTATFYGSWPVLWPEGVPFALKGIAFMYWPTIPAGTDRGSMQAIYSCYYWNGFTWFYLTPLNRCDGNVLLGMVGFLKQNHEAGLVPVVTYARGDYRFTTTSDLGADPAFAGWTRAILGYTYEVVNCDSHKNMMKCPADSSNIGSPSLNCNIPSSFDNVYHSLDDTCSPSGCAVCTGCKAPFPPTSAAPFSGSAGSCATDFPSGSTCSITCDDNFSVTGQMYSCLNGIRYGSQSCVANQIVPSCPIPSSPSNGLRGDCAYPMLLGDSCAIDCDAGFYASGIVASCRGDLSQPTIVDGQTCEICPMGTTSITPGSVGVSSCKCNRTPIAPMHGKLGACARLMGIGDSCVISCDAGFYADGSAYSCDYTTFNQNAGLQGGANCTRCPDFSTSPAVGSVGLASCKCSSIGIIPLDTLHMCPDQLSIGESCVIQCPADYYSTRFGFSCDYEQGLIRAQCVSCPAGLSSVPGSTSIHNCSCEVPFDLFDLQEGGSCSARLSVGESCVPIWCPVGHYVSQLLTCDGRTGRIGIDTSSDPRCLACPDWASSSPAGGVGIASCVCDETGQLSYHGFSQRDESRQRTVTVTRAGS